MSPRSTESCLPLLSDEVREGGIAFVQGKVERLSYDELIAESKDVIGALGEWRWRIEGCPSRTPPKRAVTRAAP